MENGAVLTDRLPELSRLHQPDHLLLWHTQDALRGGIAGFNAAVRTDQHYTLGERRNQRAVARLARPQRLAGNFACGNVACNADDAHCTTIDLHRRDRGLEQYAQPAGQRHFQLADGCPIGRQGRELLRAQGGGLRGAQQITVGSAEDVRCGDAEELFECRAACGVSTLAVLHPCRVGQAAHQHLRSQSIGQRGGIAGTHGLRCILYRRLQALAGVASGLMLKSGPDRRSRQEKPVWSWRVSLLTTQRCTVFSGETRQIVRRQQQRLQSRECGILKIR